MPHPNQQSPDPAQIDISPLFGGQLLCAQPRHGYRFSVDPVLLAHFLVPAAADKNAFDLGAGCGIISLILAHRYPQLAISALELQDNLLAIIRHNIHINKLAKRLSCVAGDLRDISNLIAPASFDLLYANPPYAAKGASRLSPNREKAIARHEIKVDMQQVLAAAAFALRVGGRAAFIYPASRRAELLSGLRVNDLIPTKLQMVCGYPGGPERLVLVAAQKGGRGEISKLPPFYILAESGGGDSVAMARLSE